MNGTTIDKQLTYRIIKPKLIFSSNNNNMLRAILTLVGIVGGGVLIDRIFSKNEDAAIGGIPKEFVHKDTLVRVFKSSNSASIKRHITMTLNAIIGDYDEFKIGMTSNITNRTRNYTDYDEMFILGESSFPAIIENLEKDYIQKYINHSKNKNTQVGGGEMNLSKSKFYLYVVVR